jgi:tetratricopeptide (TPR) repeat protein
MALTPKDHPATAWLSGLVGVVLGMCLASVFVGGAFVMRARSFGPASNFRPTVTLPPTPSRPTLTQPPMRATSATAATPGGDAEALFAEAEASLDTDPQRTIDVLSPQLRQLSSMEEFIRAYTALGQAETNLGHFQLAAAHVEKLYGYQPTAANLFWLATLYDLGGDLEEALAQYQALAEWPGLEADDYRALAQGRIQDLSEVLGRNTPTP